MKNPHDLMHQLVRAVSEHNQRRAWDMIKDLLVIALNLDVPDSMRGPAIDYLHLILLAGDRYPWLASRATEEIKMAALDRRDQPPSEGTLDEYTQLQLERDKLALAIDLINFHQTYDLDIIARVQSKRERLEFLQGKLDDLTDEIDEIISTATQFTKRENGS